MQGRDYHRCKGSRSEAFVLGPQGGCLQGVFHKIVRIVECTKKCGTRRALDSIVPCAGTAAQGLLAREGFRGCLLSCRKKGSVEFSEEEAESMASKLNIKVKVLRDRSDYAS